MDEIFVMSLLAGYKFYHRHNNNGVILQLIAPNTFSAVGSFMSLLHFLQKSTERGIPP